MLALALTLAALLPVPPRPGAPAADAYGDPLPAGAVARLGSVRWRCPDPPDHLIWSPDGKYLVGLRGHRSLTIWEYPAGAVAARVELPGTPESDDELFPPGLAPDEVRFAPDGMSMLAFTRTNELFRVRLPEGCLDRLCGVAGPVRAMAVSADGRRGLVEVSDPDTGFDLESNLAVVDLNPSGPSRRVWRRQVWEWLGANLFHSQFATADRSSMTPDGRFVLASSVGRRGDVHAVIDTRAGRRWVSRSGQFRRAWLAPDGSAFLAADEHWRLTRWRLGGSAAGRGPCGSVTCEAVADVGLAESLLFSPDGRRVVTIGPGLRPEQDSYHHVTVRDAKTLKVQAEWAYRVGGLSPIRTLVRREGAQVGDAGTELAAAVAPGNRTLAVSGADSTCIRFFDLRTGEELLRDRGHPVPIDTLRATPSGRTLVSVGSDRQGRAWDLTLLGVARGRGFPPPRSVGRRSSALGELFDADLPPTVRPSAPARVKVLYDRDHNRLEGRLAASERLVWEDTVPGLRDVSDRPGVLPEAWDPGRVSVAVVGGSAVQVRDPATGQVLWDFHVPDAWPTAVEFVPGADLLAVGYDDGQVLLWELRPPGFPNRPPTEAEFGTLWRALAGGPREAIQARMILLAHPDVAIAGLKKCVRALPEPTENDVYTWLAQLSHPRYAIRESASQSLARYIDVSELAVRETLALTHSPEVEHRLRTILGAAERLDRDADGEVARLLRVVSLLERFGTPDARELLFRIARGGGVPAARATDALERLRDRKLARGTAE